MLIPDTSVRMIDGPDLSPIPAVLFLYVLFRASPVALSFETLGRPNEKSSSIDRSLHRYLYKHVTMTRKLQTSKLKMACSPLV